MQIKNQITDVLHRIRVKLYPNHFLHVEGKYIARTDNEAVLDVDKVCNAAISRGGVECDLDDLIEYVNKYNEEVAYQLCDGYAVSNGYYTIHPNIGGTFNSENEIHDHKKHPITFRFRVLGWSFTIAGSMRLSASSPNALLLTLSLTNAACSDAV
jgi:hypothetical protein